MYRQLHAGYVLEAVRDAIQADSDDLFWSEVLRHLSSYVLESDYGDPVTEICPTAATLANIISRGLPTLAPLCVEQAIANATGATVPVSSDRNGRISWEWTVRGTELLPLIKKSLVIVDPTFELNEEYTLHSSVNQSFVEREFLHETLPEVTGEALCQLVMPQRTIRSQLEAMQLESETRNEYFEDVQGEFTQQRVDFSIDCPYSTTHGRGIIIELDGESHKDQRQRNLDTRRDAFHTKILNKPTIRLKIESPKSMQVALKSELSQISLHPYIKHAIENHRKPIYQNDNGAVAMHIALLPFAVARLQRSVVEAVRSGVLSLESPVWRIAIYERDIQCGYLAMKSVATMIDNLLTLSGKANMPTIETAVYRSGHFDDLIIEESLFEPTSSKTPFDVLIDISILQRAGLTDPVSPELIGVCAKNVVTLRSLHLPDTSSRVISTEPINYPLSADNTSEALVYFLQNVFRKSNFREGQTEILRRALARKSVIGLLPTGAGKSICYQLASLLQPGITIVVDPIKSLMRDQDQNLKSAGIRSTTFINSSIPAAERNRRLRCMQAGYYQFVFVSPERFQVTDFRNTLSGMTRIFTHYCVVDEAHCVSEWGHDFRTAYLRLGANARKFCRANDSLTIVALTGTASFDVLSDVQRELEITSDDAIVMPSKYERDELQFNVIEVTPDIEPSTRAFETRKAVGEAKQNAVCRVIDQLPLLLQEHNAKSARDLLDPSAADPVGGLVFCPHKSGYFGVSTVRNTLARTLDIEQYVGEFHGGNNLVSDADLAATQDRFKSNDLSLLIATKAFGMGIDKPNIRFTVHLSMPQSLEAFYQEAGRAGRDRRPAYCYLLYSRTDLDSSQLAGEVSIDRKIQIQFHENSFRGADKEKRIVYELLTNIRAPWTTISDQIAADTFDQTGFEVRLSVWKSRRIYVNGQNFGNSFGFIDPHRLTISCKSSGVPVAISRRVLKSVQKALKSLHITGQQLLGALTLRKEKPASDGVETLLSNNHHGPLFVLIPFTNDITALISETLGGHWTEEMATRAYNFCSDGDEYIKNLKKEYARATGKSPDFDGDLENWLKDQFPKIRDESDTYKAVYRLSIVGIIEDYTVDYRTRIITARLQWRSDDYLLDQIREYLLRYRSTHETRAICDGIPSRRGNSMLQKCLGALIEFVYSYIAARRLEAINVMEQAALEGLNNDQDFAERVNTYFDSRLTPKMRGSFLKKEFVFEDVLEFLRIEFDGSPGQVGHLRGACDRLLVEHPDHGALLVCRAVANAFSNAVAANTVNLDLTRGLHVFSESETWNEGETIQAHASLIDQIRKLDESAAVALSHGLLRYHASWLSKRNPLSPESADGRNQ